MHRCSYRFVLVSMILTSSVLVVASTAIYLDCSYVDQLAVCDRPLFWQSLSTWTTIVFMAICITVVMRVMKQYVPVVVTF